MLIYCFSLYYMNGLPVKPYQEAMERTKRDTRNQIVDCLNNVAITFGHNDYGAALQDMMPDIVKK